jgi:retron-type reverse transcriptase
MHFNQDFVHKEMATRMQDSPTLKSKVVLQPIKALKPDTAAGKQELLFAKKAVGSDSVPGDVVKLIVNHRRELIFNIMNNVTETGRIPRCWKVARVILFRKPGKDPRLPNTYRPISILPALSKVWEKCLKMLMERCMGSDPSHRRQFGFRRKRSMVDAITRVMKFADTCKKNRQICMMIALDIKSA